MEANQNEESPDKDTSTMECRVTGENRGSREGLHAKLWDSTNTPSFVPALSSKNLQPGLKRPNKKPRDGDNWGSPSKSPFREGLSQHTEVSISL